MAYVFTNWPDYWRGYHGFEVTARKRMSRSWQMNAGFSYNDARVHYDSPKAFEDPTNIENLDGAQYAPESTSSGLGNVFMNATWIFRVSGSYRTPFWGINLAGFYNSRSGYPFIANIQTPSRPNGGGIANVYLDELGDNRLDTFQTLDFRVDRRFTVRAPDDHPGDGCLQPVQRQHAALDPAGAERGQREPGQLDPGAARHPLRRPGRVVGRPFES